VENALGHPSSVLVLGGTSEIAQAITARLLDLGTTRVVLAGRDDAALEGVAKRLREGGGGRAEVRTAPFDAADADGHEATLDAAVDALGGDVDLVLLAFGLLGDQERMEADPAAAVEIATVNYVGAVSAGLHVARRFRGQGHGTLVVLSSVAGERARRANFVYGSTKAGLDAFAQGLGDALHPIGCRVVVVRPGFVTTRMTTHLDPPPGPLSTTADVVAAAVVRGLQRGAEVVYAPGVLRLVMTVVRHLPRAVVRRLPR